jgi:AraC family transcriptional regulator
MILRAFPEITWLKKQIASNFSNQRGPDNVVLAAPAWPTVVLNVKTAQAIRPDIRGPLSLFINISGRSALSIGNRRISVDDGTYLLTNQSQNYSLAIEESTETFNVHFGDRFVNDLYQSILRNDQEGLEPTKNDKIPDFYSQLLRRDEEMNGLVSQLYHANQRGTKNLLFKEELLVDLFYNLHHTQEGIKQTIARLPGQKASTKEETYKRIALAVEYMHAHYDLDLGIEELAQQSCLSKYYFIKGFKAVHRCTPYQYLLEIRLNKALQLLRTTDLRIGEIAELIGFDYVSSFSRAFYKRHGYYPSSEPKYVLA